ncbi:MAG: beta-ketoacyl-[acyl-carrier-protein] synthase family protein [Planctomycetes bacterium]|nr:beta-ketoacyl-[acyl-carrier-protein] synthase family protein [Planctomycetota bacterium]
MGLVSPLGITPEAMDDALTARRSGFARLQRIPPEGLPIALGAEARDFNAEIDDFGPLEKTLQRTIKKGTKLMCREIQMGVAAAQRCLVDAGLVVSQRDPERTGVTFGSDHIMTVPEEFTAGIRKCLDENGKFQFPRWGDLGISNVDPLWLLKYLPNMPASHIAIYNDLRGPSNSITSREASSCLAIGEAYTTIARGSADAMIAGATGTRVHALRTVHVLLQEEVARGEDLASLCRPFDRDRAGQVLGEGAGALLLEELTHARNRNARILGEVIGHGSSAVLSRRGEALPREALGNAMRQALRVADIRTEQVGHINAHGLGTRAADQAEAEAIRDLFGDRDVPVTAAKSYHGNLGAGGGVVELIASLLCLRSGSLFPTLNYRTPDPACPIRVATRDDESTGEICLKLSISPQGQAAAVVVRKWVE